MRLPRTQAVKTFDGPDFYQHAPQNAPDQLSITPQLRCILPTFVAFQNLLASLFMPPISAAYDNSSALLPIRLTRLPIGPIEAAHWCCPCCQQ